MRRIRSEDTVQVLTGKDRGKRGQVRRVLVDRDRVVVQGINVVKKHLKARAMGTQAGIIEIEAAIHVSNVAVVCPGCDKAARIGFRVRPDGVKVRYCKRCDEDLD